MDSRHAIFALAVAALLLAAAARRGRREHFSMARGEPRFELVRMVRDDLLVPPTDPELRYDLLRNRDYRSEPVGNTYSRKDCPECDPSWTVPSLSTPAQRGLSAMEAMATHEIDNQDLYAYQQGMRDLAQLAIHNPTR